MNAFDYFIARCLKFFDSVRNRFTPSHKKAREEKTNRSEEKRQPIVFGNVGGTIKTLSKVFLWLGAGLSSIVGVVYMSRGVTEHKDGLLIFGALVLFLGVFASWFNSILMYGFGTLVENSDKIAKNTTPND